MMNTSFGSLVQQQRQVRDQLLRQHVAAIRGVGLAVDRERRRAGQLLHRHRRRRALLVIEQLAGLELRFEIEILRHVRRVHVDAGRQQLAIPGRAASTTRTAAIAAVTSAGDARQCRSARPSRISATVQAIRQPLTIHSVG